LRFRTGLSVLLILENTRNANPSRIGRGFRQNATFSGVRQTSHFKGVRTVFDPIETLAVAHLGGRLTASGYANLSVLREGASGGGTSLALRYTHRVRL